MNKIHNKINACWGRGVTDLPHKHCNLPNCVANLYTVFIWNM